jgi:hypothetical protein
MTPHPQRCETCGRILPKEYKYPKKLKEITDDDLRVCREKSLVAKNGGYNLKPCNVCIYFSRCGGIS